MRGRPEFWLFLACGCGARELGSESPPAALAPPPPAPPSSSAAPAPSPATSTAAPPAKLGLLVRDAGAAPTPLPHVEIKFPILAQRVPVAKAASYRVRLKVENWPLGEKGDGVELVLDDHLPRRVKTLDQTELASLLTEGSELAVGEHLLVAAAVRGSGELVRSAEPRSLAPWAAVHFFVGEDKNGIERVDAPAVVMFEPRGTLNGASAADSAYVDFLVLGIELGPSAAKLGLSVEGEGMKAGTTLTSAGPVAIQGLPSGDFRVELGLLGADGSALRSARARAARTITVNRDAPLPKKP